MDLALHPIGYVERPSIVPDGREAKKQQAVIVVDSAYRLCCEGLEDLSHALVLWWAHERVGERFRRKRVHPECREDLPLVGLFATRSPVRPNPICVDVVRVIGRQGRRVTVEGLDARRGTPVLDIKGWYERVPSEPVTQPDWYRRLHGK